MAVSLEPLEKPGRFDTPTIANVRPPGPPAAAVPAPANLPGARPTLQILILRRKSNR